MAIDILSIPAMSAEPERVFSGSRRTISWDRACLSGKIVEQTECLKSWVREQIAQGNLTTPEVVNEVLQTAGGDLLQDKAAAGEVVVVMDN